uniref:Endoplasmic reticulum protein 27 n=1 Tax=Oryzias latipes TaxID=8090 RepID=A0A3P9KI37_ORYLA
MLFLIFQAFLMTFAIARGEDNSILKLNDTKAVEAFVDSAEVVIIGFLEGEESHGYKELVAASKKVDSVPAAVCTEKEVWAAYSVSSDTITLFRKADDQKKNLILSELQKLDVDGLVNFIATNEIRYVTEYNQVTAVGLFNAEVRTHLVIFANRGSEEYPQLKEKLATLAPEFTGKFLFVLINGALKSNFKAINYFGLTTKDLPRVGIYDGDSDMKWLLPEGEISTERVREFCQSFLRGNLKVSRPYCVYSLICGSHEGE